MYRILFSISFIFWALFSTASALHISALSGLAKMLSAAMFIMTGVLTYVKYGRTVKNKHFRLYAFFIGAGLLFSVGGDFFLMSGKTFMIGLVAFAAAQVCYFAAFFAFGAPKPGFILQFLCFFLPIAALIGIAPIFDFGEKTAAVWVYAVLISLMAAKSLDARRSDITKPFLAIGGAVLFLISDVILVFYMFAELGDVAGIVLHCCNTFTYFPAQMLLAISLCGGLPQKVKTE